MGGKTQHFVTRLLFAAITALSISELRFSSLIFTAERSADCSPGRGAAAPIPAHGRIAAAPPPLPPAGRLPAHGRLLPPPPPLLSSAAAELREVCAALGRVGAAGGDPSGAGGSVRASARGGTGWERGGAVRGRAGQCGPGATWAVRRNGGGAAGRP